MTTKPACRIYLLRHGETTNAARICFNGHYDVALSPRGEEQFQEISVALTPFPIRAVYCSDLRRTQDCAQLIARPHGLTPEAFPELRELSFGRWEGLSVEEVREQYPEEYQKSFQDLETYHAPGGETFRQLEQRVIPKFLDLVSRHPEDEIVLVCHGGVNRIILSQVLGLPLKHMFRIHQDYGAINIIQYYEESPVVEVIGGTHHHIQKPRPVERKVRIQ